LAFRQKIFNEIADLCGEANTSKILKTNMLGKTLSKVSLNIEKNGRSSADGKYDCQYKSVSS